MKRIIYTLFVVFFISTIVFAQDSIYVYKSGKIDCKSDISTIDSITFPNNNTTSIYKAGSIIYNSDVSVIDSITFSNNLTTIDFIKTPWKDNDTYLTDPLWKTDQYLTNNVSSPYLYAGIYAYENLTIGDNVNIYSSGISELVLKVKGTLTLGKNVKIWVRNGYYSNAPGTAISTLTSSNLSSKGKNFRNVYLFPSTFGKGGNGGNGGPGQAGGVTSIYLGSGSYYTIKGVGGSGGGGGGGGFGGGSAGAGGAAGSGSGGSGYAGGKGNANGGDGGYGGANASIGIGGGATGIGTHGVMSSDKIGAGGGGGGGNGGNGSSGGSSDLYYGGGAGFGGNGGGGGGYGGGILYIAAQRIVYDEKYPPNFIVSGQVGGASFQSGSGGTQGQGGLLVITTETSTLPDSIWNLKKVCVAPSEKGGHGTVKGDPQAVFINNISKGVETDTITQNTSISIPVVMVSGGTFNMGSNLGYNDEIPVHTVNLSSFYIGKYEITQNQYKTIMNSDPTSGNGSDYPIYNVSWYNAVNFCNTLSLKDKLEQVYTINGTNVTADFTKNGWRLPTEAEWEFAARGGNTSKGYYYSGSNSLTDVGWCYSNSGGYIKAIGLLKPNELGIYDMSGNVWEFVNDRFSNYTSDTQTNPTGPTTGTNRIYRGGGFGKNNVCYVWYRVSISPTWTNSNLGFRIARNKN